MLDRAPVLGDAPHLLSVVAMPPPDSPPSRGRCMQRHRATRLREKESFIPKYVYLTLSAAGLPNRHRPCLMVIHLLSVI